MKQRLKLKKKDSDQCLCKSIRNIYQKYRNWQKSKKRARRERGNLEQRKIFYSQFVSSGDLCFDVGANMGNRAQAFLELGAVVIAVEPQQECQKILSEKFSGNSNFILIDKALGEEEGEKEFFISNANTLSSMSLEWIDLVKKEQYFKDAQWSEKTIVKMTTMDTLIKAYGTPIFCKIDVEGYEYQALKGLSTPVGVVSFEFTRGFENSTLDCIRHLSGLGNSLFNYSIGETMALTLQNWVDGEEMINIITNTPREKGLSGDIYARMP